MKKLIILTGLSFSLFINIKDAAAESVIKIKVTDYLKTEFDYMYEIKNNFYPKVILDCQGFIMGMNFYYDDYLERKVYMDEETCQNVHQFLKDSKKSREPVCMELNTDDDTLLFSRKADDCQ